MPAEIMPRPTETNADKPCYLVNCTNTMLIALGRVFPLLQDLGATPAGVLMRPHGKNFTNSRDKTPSTQAKSNPRRRSKNFIASCKQSLQRVTGSKPSKGTNALPPTWQFFLSWEERPPIKDTKSLADISARLREKHEKQSPDRTGPKGCPSRKLSSGLLRQRPCGGSSWRTAPSKPSP